MRKIGLYILTAAIILVASTGTKAQEKEVFKLNTIESEAIQKAKHAEKGKIYFNLNEDVFTDPEFKAGALFELSIGEEEPVQLMIRKSLEYLPGTVSIIASKKGERERVFTGTYSNGRLNGLYHESHDKAFKISYDTERNQQFLTTNNTNETLACGLHEAEERYIAFSPDFGSNNTFKAKTTSGEYEYSPAPLNASLDDSITIDLMLVYTNPAEQWASTSEHGDINGVIAQAMSLSQAALDNSNLGIELRLVHTHKTDYDEENDGLEDSDDRLSRLTQNPDNPIYDSSEGHDGHMEEVHDLRIQYGADIVALLIKIEDTGGLGWRLGNTSGSPHYGFNLNRVQQVASNFTLIHEIGHNMGNAHARTQEEAKAETTGGLFHYSAGYQNTAENFHTIMAYADGLQEAPIFSSPDLTWEGVPAGTNNNQTPENNRLSMRQIKRTVAGYLPSIQSAPEVAVSTNEITVNMNREDEFSTTLQISNNGESGLVWNVDFDFPGNTVGKQKAVKKNFSDRIEGKFLEKPKGLPANYSARDSQFKTKQQEQVLYSSSFESNEGFGTGSFIAQSDWRTFGNSEFLISSVKPKSGSQHFRLEYDGETNDEGEPLVQFMSAPFFGYQPFGNYEVTINFEVGGTNFSNEVFDFYFFDGKTGAWSGGVIIANGTIFSADLNEEGEVEFFAENGNTANVTSGEYHTLRISFNATGEEINYYFNGLRIYTSVFLHGITPGQLQVLHRNSISNTYINVDDIEIKQLQTPYTWLSATDVSGVTLEGESSQVNLTFKTQGIGAGTYETLMKVRANDPANSLIEIPVTLEVNDAVSNEITNQPKEISLEQNYPNPFNPSTVISYQLEENSEISLQVFDMLGREVATLVNGERRAAGEHKVTFEAGNLSSGIYIYRLKTASQTLTRQMVLIK